MFITFLYSWK